MRTSDFSFDLPPELVAQVPAASREEARLMHLDRSTGAVSHHGVRDLPQVLAAVLPRPPVMVFNDSRVRRARLYASTPGGRVREFLLIRWLDAPAGRRWEAMARRSRGLIPGTRLEFPGSRAARVLGRREGLLEIEFDLPLEESYFERHGHVPLPPYIDREDTATDAERYQTVYARETGSVAAPTAGLHFGCELLARLDEAGIAREYVRLHVGIGTFLPVRTETVEEHLMHSEECWVTGEAAARLNAARAEGRRLLAVGTTAIRVLETAWDRAAERITAFEGSTRLFITPGYRFGAVDAIFTNFHTPESTLLMLVCAFGGTAAVLEAYREAVEQRYRFYSYGDAMLVT